MSTVLFFSSTNNTGTDEALVGKSLPSDTFLGNIAVTPPGALLSCLLSQFWLKPAIVTQTCPPFSSTIHCFLAQSLPWKYLLTGPHFVPVVCRRDLSLPFASGGRLRPVHSVQQPASMPATLPQTARGVPHEGVDPTVQELDSMGATGRRAQDACWGFSDSAA